MTEFQWKPLQSQTQLRIFSLSPGSRDDVIQGSIYHVELSEAGLYEGLSYEWGADPEYPENEPVIYIDRCWRRVRRNLFDALMHIRYVDRDRHLWIDALCLNQDESTPVAKAEKNRSVMQMGSIYRGATTVVVWLGLAADDSDIAMANIEWIYHNLPKETGYNLGYDDGGPQLIPDSILVTLDKLCQRSYWRRIWMIQELNLAAELDIYCGNSRTSGAAFESTLSYLYHDRRIRYPDFSNLIGSIPFDFHFNHRQPAYKNDPRKTTFSFWISEALKKEFECQKVRDVIYALIGQSHGLVDGDIIPDKEKPVEEVVVDGLVIWALGNLEPEYGSQKFVTIEQATDLANRMLGTVRAAGNVTHTWSEAHCDRFDELYGRARREWWRRVDARRAAQ